MNLSRNSSSVASALAVATVGLVCFSAIAFECPGKKAQTPESSIAGTAGNGGNTTAISPNADRNATSTENGVGSSVLKSDSAAAQKPWKLGAIALAAVAGGSTAFLAYRGWTTRAQVPTMDAYQSEGIHPEFEHPELQLAALPKEALPEASVLGESTASQRDVVLTR